MIKRLAEYKVANRMFVEYYNSSNWQLVIPLAKLLSDEYVRYQAQIFLDFIASMNIGVITTPTGFCLYIIRPDLLDEATYNAADIIFVPTETGWFNIGYFDVEVPQGVIDSNKTDALMAFVTNEAIVTAMAHINKIQNLYKK